MGKMGGMGDFLLPNWEKFTAQLGSKIFLTGQQERKTECHSKLTLCHLYSLGHAVCDIRSR